MLVYMTDFDAIAYVKGGDRKYDSPNPFWPYPVMLLGTELSAGNLDRGNNCSSRSFLSPNESSSSSKRIMYIGCVPSSLYSRDKAKVQTSKDQCEPWRSSVWPLSATVPNSECCILYPCADNRREACIRKRSLIHIYAILSSLVRVFHFYS